MLVNLNRPPGKWPGPLEKFLQDLLALMGLAFEAVVDFTWKLPASVATGLQKIQKTPKPPQNPQPAPPPIGTITKDMPPHISRSDFGDKSSQLLARGEPMGCACHTFAP